MRRACPVQVADLKAELGTELLAQLSAAERAELSKLAPQLKSLQVCTRSPLLRPPVTALPQTIHRGKTPERTHPPANAKGYPAAMCTTAMFSS